MTNAENTLTLETTKGKVVILMRPDLAPGHVARIKELVRDGFYDGVAFHRVIDGFMAQTGCPHGTGTGGSGKKLKAEFNSEPHRRGTVSMARAQSPDSGDSQFFICFADAPFLNGKYTVWGQVTEGMGNVDKIKRGEPVVDPDRMIRVQFAADAKRAVTRRISARGPNARLGSPPRRWDAGDRRAGDRRARAGIAPAAQHPQ
jgi:peptidylprolyl isomerase